MIAERRLRVVRAERHRDAREPDARLDALADHCMEVKKLADQVGTATMRRLADLLLFEVGSALAKRERHEDAASGSDPTS